MFELIELIILNSKVPTLLLEVLASCIVIIKISSLTASPAIESNSKVEEPELLDPETVDLIPFI